MTDTGSSHDGDGAPAFAPPRWLRALGYAAYLACSWTWCIGMFLPVLLVRDFGIWGFVVFAVPNVLGAAGMGWVLREPGSSEMLLIRHLVLCYWFSKITVAFQWFFVGWMAVHVGLPAACAGAVLFTGLSLVLRRGLEPVVLGAAAAVLAASLWAMKSLWGPGQTGLELLASSPPSRDLLWMAPVCLFGFGLCPYLDMTFHRARRTNPGPSGTAAFTIGFGVFFAALIVFTLAYGGLITTAPPTRTIGDLASRPLSILAAYLALHLSFTIEAHSIETRAIGAAMAKKRGRPLPWPRRIRNLVLFMLGPAALGSLGTLAPPYHGLAFTEVVYRCFMGFYGLVFPAYVWLCMIPTRDGHAGPSREKIRVWAAAVGIAAPMFWMGFVERQTWWLGPGLVVALGARLVLPRKRADEEWEG